MTNDTVYHVIQTLCDPAFHQTFAEHVNTHTRVTHICILICTPRASSHNSTGNVSMRVNKSCYNNIHFKYGKRAIPPQKKLVTTSYKKTSHESVAVADRLIIILGGGRCKKMQPRKSPQNNRVNRDGDGCLLIGTHVHPSYCTYTLICHKVGAIPFRANQCV